MTDRREPDDLLNDLPSDAEGTPPAEGAKGKARRKRRRKARGQIEPLEPRILMSATWADSDTGTAQPDATDHADTFTGSDGADTAHALDGNDLLTGGAGDDALFGDASNDTLDGGDGDDLLDGGDGNDTLNGGAGTDTASFATATTGVTANLGTGTAIGAGTDTLSNIENLSGSEGNDTLTGATGTNVLAGGSGNDTLAGGAGDDTLAGGAGTDTASYAGATGSVNVDLAAGTATGADGNDTLTGIENVTGSSYGDSLTGDAGANTLAAGAGNDHVEGGAGDDVLDGGAGLDTVHYEQATAGVTVNLTTGTAGGGAGNDTLTGFEQVVGSDHNDALTGDANANHLAGGAGNDTLDGGAGNDTLDGGSGIDTASFGTATTGVTANLGTGVATGAGTDTLSNIENLSGSGSNDVLTGDAGTNVLSGGAGHDTLSGGAGDDTLDGGTGTDTASYAGATGSVNADLAAGTATGADGADTLTGMEYITGSSYDDTLTGDAAANVLAGGAGNDQIEGGAGNDALDGGAGLDTAHYDRATAAVDVNLATGTAGGGAGSDTLTGFEQVVGSDYDDTLTGDANANNLAGGAGHDTLDGGAGNDTLDGGAGTDTASFGSATTGVTADLGTGVATGAGTDTLSNIENLSGSSSNDALTGDAGTNVLSGGAGNDTLSGGAGDDTLDGGTGTDTASYVGATGSVNADLAAGTATGADGADTLTGMENITGSSYDDTLTGDAAANVLAGGAGNDQIEGGAGNDALDGGAGLDTAHYDHATAAVNVNLATGRASGGDGSDTLTGFEQVVGSDYNDTLTGDANANTLQGGAGNDTLDGGLGNDVIDGGVGVDTVSFAANTSAVSANLTTGVATGAGTDTLRNVENLSGSAGNDALTGDAGANTLLGNAGNDTLNGGGGDDVLDGGAGTDTATYATAAGAINANLNTGAVTGGAGNDTLLNVETVIGSQYDDTIVGNAASNTIAGGAGDDVLDGGAGSDTVSYSSATGAVAVNLTTNTATGGAGSDTLAGFEHVTGSNYNDTLTGDANANTLSGGSGNDALDGGAGNDWLDGGSGNDTVTGGIGDDSLVGNTGDDVLDGGTGTDRAYYSSASAAVNVDLAAGTATGGAGNDTLAGIENVTGSNYNDTLTGDANANSMSGGSGNDTLNAGAGNDTLYGGTGDDALDGGAGTDTVSYSSAAAAVNVDLNAGRATGGEGTDTLTGLENVTGSNYHDTLTGDAGANVLSGGSGNDVIDGGAGNDTLDGGSGTDTLSYASATSSVSASLTTNKAGGGGGSDSLSNFENLTGSGFNDTLTGNSSANVLVGGGGDDVLDGAGGTDTVDYSSAEGGVTATLADGTATGAAGSDKLVNLENVTGSNSDDTLIGDGNANVLTGNAGNDRLDGGAGNDTLDGGAGDDKLDGGAGTDTVTYATATAGVKVDLEQGTANGGAGDDSLADVENVIASNYDDGLTGDANANVLIGGSGNDVLAGGAGDDTLDGGTGVDTASYAGTDGPVTVNLAAGSATGAAGTDTLRNIESITGSDHGDTLTGDANANVLAGGSGNDALSGGAGNDTLDGGAGDDVLQGGAGNDALAGGAGHDTADYSDATGSVTVDLTLTGAQNTGGAGTDTLTNVEAVVGGAYDDTFAFSNPSDGAEYTVDGGGGSNTISLSNVSKADADIDKDTGLIQVTLPDNGAFTVHYSNVDALAFRDGNILTSDTPPVAEAGGELTVNEGASVTLDATGSFDPDGDLLAYQWVQTAGPSVTLSDAQAANPTFVAPEGLTNTDATFELRVSDGSNTSVDSVVVHINADDDAPSANAGVDQTVNEGAVVQLAGQGTDPEGRSLSYEWVQVSGPQVQLSDPHAANPTFVAPDRVSNTDVAFELHVSDGANTSIDTIAVHVNADNDAPSADAGADQTVDEGAVVQLTGQGTDPEGQNLSYAWVQVSGPQVHLSNPHAANPTFVAPEGLTNSDVSFELHVSDGTHTSIDTVAVHVNADNDAPSADAGVDQTVDEGASVQLAGQGTDPEGQGLSHEWVQVSGPQVQLSDPHAPNPTFVAPEGVTNTDVSFELHVSDGTQTSVDTVAVHINANDDAPTADAGVDQTVDEGASVQLAGQGTDPEGQSLNYTWVQVSGPQVQLSDPHAANPTFVAPDSVSNTDVTFELHVSDGTHASIDTVAVHVNADNDAPSAEAGVDQTVDEGASVQLAGQGTDPEGQSLNYTWVQVSGPQVQLSDPHAANPTFVAPDSVSDTDVAFELHVSDGTHTSIDTVTVHVNDVAHAPAPTDHSVPSGADAGAAPVSPVDLAPTAEAGVDQTVEEGATVQLLGTGTDPGGQGLSYTWVQVSGPQVQLSDPHAANPSFVAPEGVSNTAVGFELHVSDGTHTSVDAVAVTVNADNDAPVAEAGADQKVTEGDPVQLQGTGRDPEGQHLTYEWVQVSGPQVQLSDAHAANPTFVAPGVVSNTDVAFELHVSDGTTTSIDTVTVHVDALNDAPTAGDDVLSTTVGVPVITGNVLANDADPNGDALGVGTYTQPAHGTVEYNGDGTFTYTPAAGFQGADQFTYALVDSQGATQSATVTIQVAAANDVPADPDASETSSAPTVSGAGRSGAVAPTAVDRPALWDGTEKLTVLDPRAGLQGTVGRGSVPGVQTDNIQHEAMPAGTPAMFGPAESEVTLDPAPTAKPLDLPVGLQGRLFGDVFAEQEEISLRDSSASSPTPLADVPPAMTTGAVPDPEAAEGEALTDPDDAPAPAKDSIWALFWGLVRGRAGSRTQPEEPVAVGDARDERQRRS